MKKILKIVIFFFLLLAAWLFVRFVIGGPEDTWLCDTTKGEWVNHGNPSAPMPIESCIK